MRDKMLSELFKGKLGLGSTFWKYGVAGLLILKFATLVFDKMLAAYLRGRTIFWYFSHQFNLIYSSYQAIVWALCYVICVAGLALYSWVMVVAVWKSSAVYDKSVWLRHLSRIGILLMVLWVWKTVNLTPLF